jgi:hypothetical protein
MPVPKPRSRLVNFRVNDEEYEILRIACAERGARSISDYARLSVLGSGGGSPASASSIERQLAALGLKVNQLENRMSDLLGRLENRGNAPQQDVEEEVLPLGAGREQRRQP